MSGCFRRCCCVNCGTELSEIPAGSLKPKISLADLMKTRNKPRQPHLLEPSVGDIIRNVYNVSFDSIPQELVVACKKCDDRFRALYTAHLELKLRSSPSSYLTRLLSQRQSDDPDEAAVSLQNSEDGVEIEQHKDTCSPKVVEEEDPLKLDDDLKSPTDDELEDEEESIVQIKLEPDVELISSCGDSISSDQVGSSGGSTHENLSSKDRPSEGQSPAGKKRILLVRRRNVDLSKAFKLNPICLSSGSPTPVTQSPVNDSIRKLLVSSTDFTAPSAAQACMPPAQSQIMKPTVGQILMPVTPQSSSASRRKQNLRSVEPLLPGPGILIPLNNPRGPTKLFLPTPTAVMSRPHNASAVDLSSEAQLVSSMTSCAQKVLHSSRNKSCVTDQATNRAAGNLGSSTLMPTTRDEAVITIEDSPPSSPAAFKDSSEATTPTVRTYGAAVSKAQVGGSSR